MAPRPTPMPIPTEADADVAAINKIARTANVANVIRPRIVIILFPSGNVGSAAMCIYPYLCGY